MDSDNVSSAATRVRYYIYGIIRKNPERSVRIPSSYQLAQEFGTTRRIVQYELERLIVRGELIGRHRVGTFTNPHSNYSCHIALDKNMPLIGVLYNRGDFFSYAATAALTLAAVYRGLAENDCYLHNLRLTSERAETMLQDILSPGIDGLLWSGFRLMQSLPEEFTVNLAKRGLPVVTMNGRHPLFSSVETDYRRAAEALGEICVREGYKNILTVEVEGRHDFVEQFNMQLAPTGIGNAMIVGSQVEILAGNAVEYLAKNETPDLIICGDGFLKLISSLLPETAKRKCRLAALTLLEGIPDFTGLLIHASPTREAEVAVAMLLQQLRSGRTTVEHRRIDAELKTVDYQ